MIRGLMVVMAMCLTMPGYAQQSATGANGAILRGLDKVNGEVADLEILRGQQAVLGTLLVELRDCRYPAGNPSGDAFAFLDIRESAAPDQPIFFGWMMASSPALNPLDHARYDVWVLRCKTS